MLHKTALAAALLLGLAGTQAHAAKTLVYCSEGSPEGMNPMFYTTGTTHDATSAQLFNRLVEFEVGTTNIVPGLATAWEVSPDNLAYTFKLRRGVKLNASDRFKPSRDFNADDVLFTWNRMADANHPFHNNTPGTNYAYFQDMGMGKVVDRVEKLDDYTVVFRLKSPLAPFLANMAMDFMSIQSAEYADKMKAAGTPEVVDSEPLGTGPFRLVSYQKDAVIRYKANENYWEGRPKIDNLIFAITPDASVRLAKVKAGECQLMAYPKPADLPALKADKSINLLTKEGLNVGYIALNVEKKPFDNKLVRQAINMAIDKKALIETIYQGAGQAAKNPIPPILWSYNDKIKDYSFDAAKAKALLAKAGYKDGFEMELWYLPVQRPYNPDGKRMAEMVQADLARIGVTAKLVTYEWGEYRKRAKNGEHQAVMFGWSGDNGDPDNFFGNLLSCDAVAGGGNFARWCDKDYDALIKKAASTPKQADRAKLYEKAQEIVKEEAVWVPIAHSVRFEPVRKSVSGFKMAAVPTNHYFQKVDVNGK
ncbi:ABC transporter substrate-binding protein [Uliginosibacterium paludis]|uniref:ABC transporter substrate-binding protein n=1 Tax=Uliginosibacterium paludis TaxID=1615952 RepID=A0ABV2CM52_9RHOO